MPAGGTGGGSVTERHIEVVTRSGLPPFWEGSVRRRKLVSTDSFRKQLLRIKASGQGYRYLGVRGEILRPPKDLQEQRRLAGTLRSIKDKSTGIQDDQIPS